jgi:acetylornithine deacetylase/succinyl-diaminopimelate desuccinylase-like protein
MVGWSENLGPWRPVRRGDRLYGRGAADDGYAVYAALTAIRAVRAAGGRHARCVVLIECSEESGSNDLSLHIDALEVRIGEPSLIVCLDSGCGNYDQLWCTTSLRGLLTAELRVDVLAAGVHSGDASGIVPGSFRIFRELLARIENGTTGEILVPECHVAIPKLRKKQAKASARVLGKELWRRFPLAGDCQPLGKKGADLVLNRTWRPWLEVVGMEGMPSSGAAGSVLRPFTSGKLSLRLPPTADGAQCLAALARALQRDPPHGAKVTFRGAAPQRGWDAPAQQPWLEDACAAASNAFFGRPCASMGSGGTIPLLNLLGERFPAAQFLVTGVLGPQSNAHGPDEFLHLPMVKRLCACLAVVLERHCTREQRETFVVPVRPAGAKKRKKGGKDGKRKRRE